MDPITPGNRSRETKPGDREARPGGQGVSPEVYWRRRVFALAAGLAVFGLLAWAIGGASATHQVASTTSFSNQSQPPVTPSDFPSPFISSASPSPSLSLSPSPSSSSPSPSPSPSGSKVPGKQAKKAKAASAHHGAGKHGNGKHGAGKHRARRRAPSGLNAPGDDCPAGDVVVSLAASGDTFDGAARPQFTITVVSTAGRACRFNVGTRYLTLIIESGRAREWGSGDCVHGAGTKVAMLTRGVPVQRKLTWNRTLSAPGCHLPATAARSGTYTATASDARVHSHTVAFLLR